MSAFKLQRRQRYEPCIWPACYVQPMAPGPHGYQDSCNAASTQTCELAPNASRLVFHIFVTLLHTSWVWTLLVMVQNQTYLNNNSVCKIIYAHTCVCGMKVKGCFSMRERAGWGRAVEVKVGWCVYMGWGRGSRRQGRLMCAHGCLDEDVFWGLRWWHSGQGLTWGTPSYSASVIKHQDTL